MPASSSSRATASTFSMRALENTWRTASAPRRDLPGLPFDHPDHPFLRGARDQVAGAVVDHAAGQSARALRAGAVDGVEQPGVGAKRAVEPERAAERSHLDRKSV